MPAPIPVSEPGGRSMVQIARLNEQIDRSIDRLEPRQVIVLDYFQHAGELEEYAAFSRHGVWLRHPESLPSGTRVALHLVLPDLFAPIMLRGTVAGSRTDRNGGQPWMLVWFDERRGEDYLLLERFLREQTAH